MTEVSCALESGKFGWVSKRGCPVRKFLSFCDILDMVGERERALSKSKTLNLKVGRLEKIPY